ncbi:hypothetical protein ACG74X_21140 [Marivita sp. S0852]|uniref:hypothetical protein n=1 Tax=Marivita sp. S0852 TaxID=3373893 RepID=UPI0039820C04
MNNRNCEGEAYFVRDMGVYAAPVDDDPVRGSLVLSRSAFIEGAEYQVAQVATGTMKDAAPADSAGAQPRTQTSTNRRGRFGEPWFLPLLDGVLGGAVTRRRIETELSQLDHYATTPELGLTAGQMAALGRAADMIRGGALPASDLEQARDIKDRAWELVGAGPTAFEGPGLLTDDDIDRILRGEITLEEAMREPDEDPEPEEDPPPPFPIPFPPGCGLTRPHVILSLSLLQFLKTGQERNCNASWDYNRRF